MFMSLIRERRSIRKYDARPVEQEKIDLIIEAALRSPSSRSLNPWQFIVVTDPETLKKLAKSKEHGSEFIGGAPLGIAVIADPERCDVWIEDCSIASIFIQLAAHSLGLGSCWIQIRKRMRSENQASEAYVKNLLGIPENLVVESLIAIGYPLENKKGHAEKNLQMGKIHWNSFGGHK
ncbi:nitroreductase family protein [Desulforegula conservatrix]|uniref:nitroreductase family protein n=1 Tax=Desulforegula conservatrix TaxID=153026 RepID=UPI00042A070A|nr:nitroreductase family protein [Desulforegula conservatrix]